MRHVRAGVVAGLMAGLVAGGGRTVEAHHSFSAEFDETKPVTFTGKVTSLKWSNPHAWIYVDVVGANKKVVNWALEIQAANALYRRGWRKEELAPGTVLAIEGFQARNGTPTANAVSVTLPSGRRLSSGPQPATPAAGAR